MREITLTMRIAVISEHASPLKVLGSVDSGGQNVYVAQVAKNLVRNGYQVDVFTRRDDKDLPKVVEWEGMRVIHVPAGPPSYVRKEELLPYMDEFTSFFDQFYQWQLKPYDLIHAHFWMSGLVAANIKKLFGIPFVITFHALGRVRRIHQGEADDFPDQRFEIEDRIISECDQLIAECPQDHDDLVNLYRADPAKITLVPCGFDPEEFWPIDKSEARQHIGIESGVFTLLQLGRIVPRKGVDTVIEGFSQFSKKVNTRCNLVIVGGEHEDPLLDRSIEMARLRKLATDEKVEDSIKFVGRRGRADLKYYYSASDIFITMPWYEPFGITPVEAMACGTPVVGANVGGIKFTVSDGRNGLLVPPRNSAELASKLVYLFENPTLIEKFRLESIRRANELFSWKKVTQEISKMYEKVLRAPPAWDRDEVSDCRINSRVRM
jgi:D-inositol-3-phosphate glycosyltransferase